MSNVIRFLESMGSEAQWGDVGDRQLSVELAKAEVEDVLRPAIMNKDVAQLHALLHKEMPIGYVSPSNPENPDEEEEEGDDEPGEKNLYRKLSVPSVLQT
ncbi:hypothetical protein [Dyella sp.]|uniref:hypothetical protein n=1 Tax=Dyella sp. TaxID=1869338 RepID=UPI002B45A292|nr:hypothetical protein [Dyella sp.]HKT29372.1 hypothetical protein [Dyella sp.]